MSGIWPVVASGTGMSVVGAGVGVAVGVGVAAGVGVVSYGAFHPRSGLLAEVICRGRGEAGQGGVALTFDDGPHPEATPAILDVLGELGVQAAFFVIGAHAARHPDLLRRIDADGHVIGNHTYAHAYHGMWRGRRYWEAELTRTEGVIADAIGKRPRLFRPPMGFKQVLMGRAVRRCGYSMVTWTRRGRDGWPTESAAIVRRLTAGVKGGEILTLHDGTDLHSGGRDVWPTVRAVGPVVAAVRDAGLRLERLDRLIGVAGYAEK